MQDIKQQIHNLVQKYEQNRSFYITSRFNETELRSQFLDPLFEILGWDIRNVSGKNTNEREVLLEESLRANASTHSKKPDYTFRLFAERKFFLEAKKTSVNIINDNEPAKQVRRYGYTAGLKVSLLSNFEYLLIYDTSYPVEENDDWDKALIKKYHYSDYELLAEELIHSFGRESVYSGEFDDVWQDIIPTINHINIDQRFLVQINEWRLLLGRQILEADPTIGIVELGDVVQSYINKILFLRVCEDRNIETYQDLLAIADNDKYEELISKFREADRRYNSGLFDELLSEQLVCNISSSFWTIIKQLYYPECPYSFAVLSSDILGKIYEIFLAQKLDLINGELAIVDKPENVERDIVTTPNFVVREILSQTLANIVLDKNDQQIKELKCADIACGSGAFLLELYQYLCDYLVDYYLLNDRTKLVQTNINTYKLNYKTKCNLLINCIYGVDKDFNAVEACKFGLLLKLLEGETEDSLSSYHPILPKLDNNIFFGNSLLSPDVVPEELIEEVNPFDWNTMKFDLIVGNPPYMKTEDIKKFTPQEKKLYEKDDCFVSAYKQYDKYFLFIERALSLLKAGGFLGYIVPSKFMKVGSAKKLRGLISELKCLKSITSFGAYQVFEDKSNYTCIIVLGNQEHNSFEYSEVDNFSKWKVRSSSAVSSGMRNSEILSNDTWILYTDRHKRLFDAITLKSKPLVDIVGDDNIFNGIQTSANQIYIFVPKSEDRNTYTFKAKFNGKEYQIEKSVTKPYFKTAQGVDSLNTYRTFAPNARVIFPYKRNALGHLDLLPLDTIKRAYPLLYAFLMDAKDLLSKSSRDIQPKPETENEWYRYGRHQSLEACEIAEKIIVGVLAQSEKYAIDHEGSLVSSGGTAGYCLISVPPSCRYSIYYIQAILGSIQVEWLASLYGEIFRGGYIARGTKVLKQMPIKAIDFSDPEEVAKHDDIVNRQRTLIRLGDKIASCNGNPRKLVPLERQFNALKQEQQKSINQLYGMSDNEVLQIPQIKELYATN